MNKKQSRTCISVIKNRRGRLLMAGDRRASLDWSRAEEMEMPKINKKNGVLLGATGSGSLCTLLVEILEPPEVLNDLNRYMFFRFKEAIYKLLINQRYCDKEKHLMLPVDDYCELVVGIKGRVYTVILHNPYSPEQAQGGIIEIDRVSTPYATGCGGSSSLPILLAEKRAVGYNTEAGLMNAMQIAAAISPGCDANIDIIGE